MRREMDGVAGHLEASLPLVVLQPVGPPLETGDPLRLNSQAIDLVYHLSTRKRM